MRRHWGKGKPTIHEHYQIAFDRYNFCYHSCDRLFPGLQTPTGADYAGSTYRTAK